MYECCELLFISLPKALSPCMTNVEEKLNVIVPA